MTIQKNPGVIVLSIWLFIFGMLTAPFLRVHFAHSADLMAVLAMIAGVLLLVTR